MKTESIKKPTCRECGHMKMTHRAEVTSNNRGKPRGSCYCKHPKAEEVFRRVCPRSPRAPGFIDFTPMGGDKPKIKTAPVWCPLRAEMERADRERV